MKSSKINYVVVGLFVIAMVAGLVGAVVVLSGRTGATDPYYAVYRNVTGVKFGTQVLYEGYPIGQVESVTPVAEDGGMKFKVAMSVQEGWKIPRDSEAQIRAPGLLSAITISIEAGDAARALEPGDEIPSKEAANIFAVMSSVAGDISELAENNLKPLLVNLDRTVGILGDILEDDGQRLVKEVLAMVGDVNQRIPQIAENIDSFSAEMRKASTELSAFLSPENRQAMEKIINSLNTASDDLEKTAKTATRVLEDTRGLVGNADAVVGNTGELVANTNAMVIENRESVGATIKDLRYVTESMSRHIDTINQNLEGTARNMYEFSRQIRQNPGLLLGGRPPEDEAKRQ